MFADKRYRIGTKKWRHVHEFCDGQYVRVGIQFVANFESRVRPGAHQNRPKKRAPCQTFGKRSFRQAKSDRRPDKRNLQRLHTWDDRAFHHNIAIRRRFDFLHRPAPSDENFIAHAQQTRSRPWRQTFPTAQQHLIRPDEGHARFTSLETQAKFEKNWFVAFGIQQWISQRQWFVFP